MSLSLSEAAAITGGRVHGADGLFTGMAIDTRWLLPEQLFVALAGEHTDGHGFLPEARARGAAAALVERPVDDHLRQLEVADCRAAMGRLAAHWRARFDVPVVAITGSNGKTTVRAMMAAILGEAGRVLATEGNLNNDLGVPLTLARLAPDHDYAVVEMGANHRGEIAALAALACPTVALITQCAPAHLEGFGSIQGVAEAKGEIYGALGDDGFAVINADDDFAPLWRGLAGNRHRLTFGLAAPADVTATWQAGAGGSELRIASPVGSFGVHLPLPGRHNVCNALAATAAALALGLGPETIAAGLARVAGVGGRLQLRPGMRGARVVDDSYNANPGSLLAAIDFLRELDAEGWLVLGEMAELGEEAPRLHREAGEYARRAGVERLYAVGALGAEAVAGFGAGGRHYDGRASLIADLEDALHDGVAVLVKGSRSARMDEVVAALVRENG
ncbi:MAG: UDP-N-acetylmuramoyl-tripeptide--D-alanyl-D-alanine ligase [Gammaproteobacteria bacterium]|nr:UDP-N-acetylmuramoyl-tripeptide--D-alanyl-D-alanine ligase [Gammaproteobacteria bacterium]